MTLQELPGPNSASRISPYSPSHSLQDALNFLAEAQLFVETCDANCCRIATSTHNGVVSKFYTPFNPIVYHPFIVRHRPWGFITRARPSVIWSCCWSCIECKTVLYTSPLVPVLYWWVWVKPRYGWSLYQTAAAATVRCFIPHKFVIIDLIHPHINNKWEAKE